MKVTKVILKQSTNAISILYVLDGKNLGIVLTPEKILENINELQLARDLLHRACMEIISMATNDELVNEIDNFLDNTISWDDAAEQSVQRTAGTPCEYCGLSDGKHDISKHVAYIRSR